MKLVDEGGVAVVIEASELLVLKKTLSTEIQN
jgi:hypothetical protein